MPNQDQERHDFRLGFLRANGAQIPKTKNGDEVACYGSHQTGCEPQVGLIVNLETIELTPREARDLATSLIFHADQVEAVS